eukprot:GHVU01007610.1.p1 GENE.GHVU01007610.1~~GHVU01007610.1.p1  ORF type:complete len:563 (-),score=133.58 GHVU01007610.1:56-1744(-)
MHLTCVGASAEGVRDVLTRCKEIGIQNILALRGDPPNGAESWVQQEGGFSHAIDLVRFIRAEFGDYFCVVVGGYPEGHLENSDPEDDLQRLKEKCDAGGEVIITQLFYDVTRYNDFVRRVRKMGVTAVILPGLLPIQSLAAFNKVTKWCRTFVPASIRERLEQIGDDDQSVKEYGVELCIEMCQDILIERTAPGLHFYTMNLEWSVMAVIEGLDLVVRHQPNREFPWRQLLGERGKTEAVRPIFWANRPSSYARRTAQWDEFPNGRWGLRDSPAYGEIDQIVISASTDPTDRSVQRKREMWGEAENRVQVEAVFVKFVRGDAGVTRLPWCSERVQKETVTVMEQLIKLIRCGLLTINSQPRVNGANASDPIYGWGPKGGLCFQKAYLEFFVHPRMFEEVLLPALKAGRYLSWMAAAKDDVALRWSNYEAGAVNAVTWGVFPRSQIMQPTVVDVESFLSWKEEAVKLWDEWRLLYPEGSRGHNTISKIQSEWVLVNIVDEDYHRGDLFTYLIGAIVAASPLLSSRAPSCCRRLSAASHDSTWSADDRTKLDDDSSSSQQQQQN